MHLNFWFQYYPSQNAAQLKVSYNSWELHKSISIFLTWVQCRLYSFDVVGSWTCAQDFPGGKPAATTSSSKSSPPAGMLTGFFIAAMVRQESSLSRSRISFTLHGIPAAARIHLMSSHSRSSRAVCRWYAGFLKTRRWMRASAPPAAHSRSPPSTCPYTPSSFSNSWTIRAGDLHRRPTELFADSLTG